MNPDEAIKAMSTALTQLDNVRTSTDPDPDPLFRVYLDNAHAALEKALKRAEEIQDASVLV